MLKSWAIPKQPSMNPAIKRLAGGFEGRIPEGEYGAGHVRIWDRGRYDPVNSRAGKHWLRDAIDAGRVEFSLQGRKLKGIRINFEAIRAHKLEQKLRDALAQMGVKKGVLQEVFHPDVQLKEGFFEHLSAVVSRTLKSNEDLAEKLYEVIQVLDPAEQIRSADSPNLNPVQSFKLIHDTQIAVSEDLDELED